jgi:Rod binding domain-containing protein
MAAISSLASAAPPVRSASGAQKRSDDPKRVADAAQQFESLMIAQLLKSMRESGTGGWLGTGEDQAGAQAVELAESQMAQALAKQGGLGLAHLVVKGLQCDSHPASESPHPAVQKLQP